MNTATSTDAAKQSPRRRFSLFAMYAGLLGLACLLAGCSAANSLLGGNSRKQAIGEITWGFAENAVLIEIEADARLNEYSGEAHTLVLGIYQMEDSAGFYKLAADSSLLAKALETGKAGDGFVNFVRYVVNPGQRSIMTVDRAQKTKFVGLVAGYYQMDASKSARLFEIPLTVASEGLLSTTWKAAPAVLALRLNLGPAGVVNAQRLNSDVAVNPKLEAIPLDGGGKALKLGAEDIKRALDAGNAVKRLDK